MLVLDKLKLILPQKPGGGLMDSLKKGKYIIIAIIALIAINDIFGLSFLARIYVNLGDMKAALTMGLQELAKVLIHFLLLYSIYKGNYWAKIIMASLLAFLGISYLLGVLYGLSAVEMWYTAGLGLLYIGIALLLFFSKSVKEFSLYQRDKAKGSNIRSEEVE
jgi:hypothetical protein